MAWVTLIMAGLCEVIGVVAMQRWTRNRSWKTIIGLALCFVASFTFLSLAMRDLPMGTAYAVWTGIGAAGGAILGMWVFGESRDWKRVLFITMILGAAVGLKAVS